MNKEQMNQRERVFAEVVQVQVQGIRGLLFGERTHSESAKRSAEIDIRSASKST